MDAAHHRPLRRNQSLDFKAQVVQEVGVLLAEGFLVIADAGVQADTLDKTQAQPRLQPGPQAESPGEFTEGLGRGVGERVALVEASSGLRQGAVQQGVGVELQCQWPRAQQAAVEADTQEVLRT